MPGIEKVTVINHKSNSAYIAIIFDGLADITCKQFWKYSNGVASLCTVHYLDENFKDFLESNSVELV